MRCNANELYVKDSSGVVDKAPIIVRPYVNRRLACTVNNSTKLLLGDDERLLNEELLTGQVVKACPLCQKPTYLDGGCNYMKCSQSDPPSNCPAEWCFLCHKIKYRPIPGKLNQGCCNDVRHNSH